jgi:diaminopimelate epimerase
MRIYNADGSRAEMCGNAARCVADYLYRHRRIVRDIRIHTLAGPIAVQGDGNGRWSVDMGCPIFEAERIPTLLPGPVMGQLLRVGDTECRVTALSMGNPHCVLFVEHLDAAPVAQLGPALCEHTVFPRRTNVEWVEVIDRSRIRMRVWERGAGITPACGTGACAAAVAAAWHGYTDRHLWVQLDGGELEIIWNQNDRVTMTGPATEVFSGQFACTRQEE